MGESINTQALESTTQLKPTEEKSTRIHSLRSQCFNPKKYDYDFSFKSSNPHDPWSIHTTSELLQHLDLYPNTEIESKIIHFNENGYCYKSLDSKEFKESFYREKSSLKMKEGRDTFSIYPDNAGNGGFGGLVGQDFIPLLGGPYFKNLYYYQDYIRMHSEAFYAYHNDPLAKAFTSITRDFVIGTGFSVQCDTTDRSGKVAMALWETFVEVNQFDQQMDDLCIELSVYGEDLLWWLPNQQTKIVYDLPTYQIPTAVIPRVRLLDPSNMIEIITYPEDITRKLAYVWLTPTQYQIYSSGLGSASLVDQPIQPTLKFIYQQIPADQIMHTKVNSVSNEKRGRSDLFPIFGYLKRLRDSIEFDMIALQKISAWAIDTTIDGNQSDIDAYVQSQIALGTIPQAGSEFVHSKAVSREYLGNSGGGGGGSVSDAVLWCLSMCCIGVQIPFNYLGTHLSGGSTRASAIVATEPVIKKMEKRREVLKRVVKDAWNRLMKEAGLPKIDCTINFPELITQDRSQKIQDLALMEQSQWISGQTAAEIAAKEMNIIGYDYNKEKEKISQDPPINLPLTTPPTQDSPHDPYSPQGGMNHIDQPDHSSFTSQDRNEVKKNDSTL